MKGQWTQQRRRNCFTLKIVVAACVVLFFFSSAFSRKLPAESRAHVGRSSLRERRERRMVEIKSEVERRVLDEVGAQADDYATPTHNHNDEVDTLTPPDPRKASSSRGTMRYRRDQASKQFARYTKHYGHNHLRGA